MTTTSLVGAGVDDLLAAIHTLWNAERCEFAVQYEPASYGNPADPEVVLSWTDDGYGQPHAATFTTYHWHFTGDGLRDALQETLEWLQALAPWKVCDR